MADLPAAQPAGLQLLDRLRAGERSAVSEALNLIDDARPERRGAALALLDTLASECDAGRALRVGVTGAPGSGKSTLLDALAHRLSEEGRSIGIIAVDPSSQRSGGALLGDRMRLGARARERGVFLRSMAARDRLGGLADATRAGVEVLAAVFDVVFVETVGVGQSESEVARVVDHVVFVAQPGAGDMLQFMKAGILELPDLFVVNKSDLGPTAERTARELAAGLGLGETRGDGWRPPVLLASARDGVGIGEIVESLAAHRAHLDRTGELARRRSRGRADFVRAALVRRYGEYGLDHLGGWAGLLARIEVARGRSAFRLVHELGREIEDSLRKP